MKKRYSGYMIFGVLLLVIGFGLYTYQVTNFGEKTTYGFPVTISYPYQSLGLILFIAGIMFIGFGGLSFISTEREPSQSVRLHLLLFAKYLRHERKEWESKATKSLINQGLRE